ncbi:MAG: hypothetical protein ACKVRN_11005 [Pyrinomonadaceae bacterium]
MAKTNALRDDEQRMDEPVNLGDRAIDNLKFIRETMERSTSFTAVPGYGGILMGVTAVVAAYIASTQEYISETLITWFVEACLAFAIGLLAMWQKSKIAGQSLVSAPARMFALSFAPPLIAGVIVVLGLWKYGHYYQMAPVCMLAYGAAVACGGAFSVRVIPVMGWCFMALGAVAFVLPTNYGNLMMALSFGVLHIVFGAIIARRYGG